MKKLIILCVIIGIFCYYYKDGQAALENVKAAATEISATIKRLF